MITYRAYGPVTEADMAALQSRIDHPLPSDYRSWLKETNGAHVGTLGVGGGVVNTFVGVLDTDTGGGLAQRQASRDEGFGAWVPADFLLISYGQGGAVCLKATEPDRGSVWWADFDLAVELIPEDDDNGAEPLPGIMSRLADTWTKFLAEYEDPPLTAEERSEIDDMVARSR